MKYSIVIPFYNEEENAVFLLSELQGVLPSLPKETEIVAVDDGSSDRTFENLKECRKTNPALRILRLEKRSGQSAALWAGIQNSRGEFVITLDGDGQNDPSDIPAVLQALGEGDAVFGWRKERQDPFIKKVSSLIANSFRTWILGFDVHDTGCGLKVMRKSLFADIVPFRGMHRFFPALLRLKGARFSELPVRHRPRIKGKTKYSISNRLLTSLGDLFAVRWMQKKKIDYSIKETV